MISYFLQHFKVAQGCICYVFLICLASGTQPLSLGEIKNRLVTEKERLASIADFPKQQTLPFTQEIIQHYLTALGFNSELKDNAETPEALKEQIKDFQHRHSLNSDGICGVKTAYMLSLSSPERMRRIDYVLHMIETQDWEKGRVILINIPTFQLIALEDGHVSFMQKIIVGTAERRTPLMTTPLTGVVMNPYWVVPKSILLKDKIKKIQEDPNYLDNHHYEIFDQDGIAINQHDIDWSLIDDQSCPYKIRQDPGDFNALGRIKFHLVNNASIYMHDTPDKKLFNRNERALSSGCIRVQDPMMLASWILGKTIENYGDDTYTLPVKPPIPVIVTYLPVWIDDEDTLLWGSEPYGPPILPPLNKEDTTQPVAGTATQKLAESETPLQAPLVETTSTL